MLGEAEPWKAAGNVLVGEWHDAESHGQGAGSAHGDLCHPSQVPIHEDQPYNSRISWDFPTNAKNNGATLRNQPLIISLSESKLHQVTWKL